MIFQHIINCISGNQSGSIAATIFFYVFGWVPNDILSVLMGINVLNTVDVGLKIISTLLAICLSFVLLYINIPKFKEQWKKRHHK